MAALSCQQVGLLGQSFHLDSNRGFLSASLAWVSTSKLVQTVPKSRSPARMALARLCPSSTAAAGVQTPARTPDRWRRWPLAAWCSEAPAARTEPAQVLARVADTGALPVEGTAQPALVDGVVACMEITTHPRMRARPYTSTCPANSPWSPAPAPAAASAKASPWCWLRPASRTPVGQRSPPPAVSPDQDPRPT